MISILVFYSQPSEALHRGQRCDKLAETKCKPLIQRLIYTYIIDPLAALAPTYGCYNPETTTNQDEENI